MGVRTEEWNSFEEEFRDLQKNISNITKLEPKQTL
jgi:hypothetical protein